VIEDDRILLLLQSCYEPGEIQVQNNISNVKIMDIRWGSAYIVTELLPGETSEKRTVHKSLVELPASNRLSFTMKANNQSVYLETEEEFFLDEDEKLIIVLTDDTEVTNPN
jgi:hypothetical protein